MKTPLLSRGGFSLIEALIALGVVSVLAFVIAEMMTQSAANARSLSDKLEILQLKDLMIRVMADGDVCTKILGGSTPKKILTPVILLQKSRYHLFPCRRRQELRI